jgi:diacylglycerol kinase (ATP)
VPKKFIKSFKYAGAGVQHILRTQRNIWVHIAIGLAALGTALWFRVSLAEMAVLALTVAFVIVAEMFNTAIEEIVNVIKPETHPLAGLIKNIAAAAVLASALGAVAVGALIFLPRVLKCS